MPSTPSAEDLAAESARLHDQVREAHETLKDLRAATREARRLIPELVTETITAEVTQRLAELGAATEQAMEEAVTKVTREFDRLLDMALGRTPAHRKRGQAPIPEMFRKAAEATTTCCSKPPGSVCIHDRMP